MLGTLQRSLKRLTGAPIVEFPDCSQAAGTFVPDTDAIGTGIRVLSQMNAETQEYIFECASVLESVLEITDCLAYLCPRYSKHYWLGRRFVVRTDHQSPKWLQNVKQYEGQVARWQEQMQKSDFECQDRPGRYPAVTVGRVILQHAT